MPQKRGGGSSEPIPPVGAMVRERGQITYQQFGTSSYLESSASHSKSSIRQNCCNIQRQQDSPILYSQTGRHQVLASVPPSEGTAGVGRTEQDPLNPSICSGVCQCCRGPTQQEATSTEYGMDSVSSSVSSSVVSVGDTVPRSFCNLPQPQTSQVHLSPSRSTSLGSRCNASRLVAQGPVRVSTFRSNQACNQQDEDFCKLQNDSSGSLVATKGMVSRSVGPSFRHSQAVTLQERATQTATVREASSQPPRAKPSRLETLHLLLRNKGLSRDTFDPIFKARCKATNQLYQRQWLTYWSWCREKGVSCTRTSINNICKFILFLRRKKKFSVQTIKGYRSMLASMLRHLDFDISHNQDLSDIIRSFQIETPKRSKNLQWNLDVVLKHLTSNKFEPLDHTSLLNLTKKTIFLLALATAHRVSELQGLSRKVGFSSEGALISWRHSFRAKNDTKCKSLPRHFLVKSLQDLVGQEEEALLCPVRALRIYLKRTKGFVNKAHVNLFCSPRKPTLPMSKGGISYFIRMLIKEAHKELDENYCPLIKVRAHDVRAVATSYNFHKNLSLETVINAARWRCKSVFATHYLKDVEISYDECCALGPIIAAGSVVA